MPPTSGVKVKLDKERTLRFTTRALMRVEDETGWTFIEAGEKMRFGSMKALVSLLWAGLLHEDPKLTLDAAADLYDQGTLEGVSAAVTSALLAHLGAEVAKNGDAGKAEPAPSPPES